MKLNWAQYFDERNKDGSINWRCQNYWKKDLTHYQITCTTLANEFIRGREAPMAHNNAAGQLVHRSPTQEKKYAMKIAQEVPETVPVSTKPLQQIWNKAAIQYLQIPGIDFTQFFSPCHNSKTYEPNYFKFAEKICYYFQKLEKQSTKMINLY